MLSLFITRKKNLAIKWDFNAEILNLNDLIRFAQIEGLKELKALYIMQAISAKKEYKYTVASEYYDKAIKVNSEIFKLGETEIEKELRKLKKKKGINSTL